MENPLLTFDGKDLLVILALAQATATFAVLAVGGVLWALAHFGVWR